METHHLKATHSAFKNQRYEISLLFFHYTTCFFPLVLVGIAFKQFKIFGFLLYAINFYEFGSLTTDICNWLSHIAQEMKWKWQMQGDVIQDGKVKLVLGVVSYFVTMIAGSYYGDSAKRIRDAKGICICY